MAKKGRKSAQVQTVAEKQAEKDVKSFSSAKKKLEEFLSYEDVREIYAELVSMVNRYNHTLDEALRSVKSAVQASNKSRLAIDGIGANKRTKRWYDPDVLMNNLDEDLLDAILTEKISYDVDKDELEKLVRQGEIDEELVRLAYKEEEQSPAVMSGTPKPFKLPDLPSL
jgi:hypothetical protein